MCGKLPNVAAINQIFILVVVAGAIATVFFCYFQICLKIKNMEKLKKDYFYCLTKNRKHFSRLKTKQILKNIINYKIKI